MKVLLTENNKQEIAKILKEQNKKIQKTINFVISDENKFSVSFLNKKVVQKDIFFNKYIEVLEQGSDGSCISGRSDKTYLSDCIGRLTQNTRNFQKAIKRHNFCVYKKKFFSLNGEKVNLYITNRVNYEDFKNAIKEVFLPRFAQQGKVCNFKFVQRYYHLIAGTRKVSTYQIYTLYFVQETQHEKIKKVIKLRNKETKNLVQSFEEKLQTTLK